MERFPKQRTSDEDRETIKRYDLDFPCWDDQKRQVTCPDIRCPNTLRCQVSGLTLIQAKLLEDDGVSIESINQLIPEIKSDLEVRVSDLFNQLTPSLEDLGMHLDHIKKLD